jgi:hypothetical protein
VGFDTGEHFLGAAGRLQAIGPSAARVQNIPSRLLAADTTGSGVVVTKTVNNDIPEWLEMTDKQTFAKRYKNFVHDKPATPEIRN